MVGWVNGYLDKWMVGCVEEWMGGWIIGLICRNLYYFIFILVFKVIFIVKGF